MDLNYSHMREEIEINMVTKVIGNQGNKELVVKEKPLVAKEETSCC